MSEVTAKSLRRNSIYAGVAEAWRILSRFILTPVIIARLGISGYGTWTILFTVCSYVDMFNMSFGFAYNKFAAEYDRKKDYNTLSSLLSAGIVLVGAIAALALSVVWIGRYWILNELNVAPELLNDAATALLLVSLCLLLRMSFGNVFYVLSGLQRLDLQHKLSIFASIIEFVASVALLAMDYGLLALAYGHCAGQILSTGAAWVLCKRLRPALYISPFCITRDSCRKVLSLGMRFQALSGLAMLFTQGIKLIISILWSPALVGVYELAEKLLSLSRALSGALIDPLMPAFSNLHAGKDQEKAHSLFVHSSKLVAMTGMAALAGLFVYADRIILAWTGQPEPLAAWTIRVMAFGHFVWVMTGPGSSVLRGKGSLRLELSNSILRTALAAILIVPAYFWGGYKGLVIAVVVSRVVSSIWFLVRFAEQNDHGFAWYFRDILGRATVIGVAVCLVGMCVRTIPTGWVPGSSERWRAAIEVVMLGSPFGVLAAAMLWYAIFTRTERQYLLQRLLPGRRGGAAVSQ